MSLITFSSVKHFVSTMAKWLSSGGGLVDQNTANIRALTCSGCHNNQATVEVVGGCSSCRKGANKAIDALRSSIIQHNSTPRDSNLKVCKICGCDIKTMIWFPNAALLTTEESNAYPQFCWKKKIEDGTEV